MMSQNCTLQAGQHFSAVHCQVGEGSLQILIVLVMFMDYRLQTHLHNIHTCMISVLD